MHGVILAHLRHFVTDRYGQSVWDDVNHRAGLTDCLHVPIQLYPDSHLEDLVAALQSVTGLHRDDLLEEFGAWVIPPLINMYRAMIPREWDAVAFLLNVEERIHQRVIRLKNPEATPPRIDVRELEPRVLQVEYRSHRDLSLLALGCVHGVAAFYGEKVEILESDQVDGGVRRFVVRLEPAA